MKNDPTADEREAVPLMLTRWGAFPLRAVSLSPAWELAEHFRNLPTASGKTGIR
jgi:hypothetical protein